MFGGHYERLVIVSVLNELTLKFFFICFVLCYIFVIFIDRNTTIYAILVENIYFLIKLCNFVTSFTNSIAVKQLNVVVNRRKFLKQMCVQPFSGMLRIPKYEAR